MLRKFANAIAVCLIGSACLVSMSVQANVATDGLEEYEYNEMILLKVIPGKGHAGAACFAATHDWTKGVKYVWVHHFDAVGKHEGELDKVLKDRVHILATQGVNGQDWIEISFYWPVATDKDSRRLVAGCGNRPNR